MLPFLFAAMCETLTNTEGKMVGGDRVELPTSSV